jgi:hypothetical protein
MGCTAVFLRFFSTFVFHFVCSLEEYEESDEEYEESDKPCG